MSELEARFGNVARGRTVSVEFDPKLPVSDFPEESPYDYQVAFSPETNTFRVGLRRRGCFEGAYRCIERKIEWKAEELDGIKSASAGYLDLRTDMQYWLFEKVYEQFRSDLESAVADKVGWLQRVRPDEGVFGGVTVEARTRSLLGLVAHMQHTDAEVRRGLLSPATVELLKNIGLFP